MTLMAREFKASFAFVERNFNLTKRYWGWEFAWLIYSVAGALAVSLIGRSEGSERLLLVLVVGAIFWNFLSLVFEFIAETVQWERWEGTLEYTFMAPVRRYAQLMGSAIYAIGYGLIHTAVVLTVLALIHVAVIGAALGAPVSIHRLVPIALGVMLIAIGNQLPRARPNWWFGIRTPWTLSNDRVWERTHRVGGYLMTAAGAAIMVGAFVTSLAGPLVIVCIAGSALGSVIYSYVAWRQETSR